MGTNHTIQYQIMQEIINQLGKNDIKDSFGWHEKDAKYMKFTFL